MSKLIRLAGTAAIATVLVVGAAYGAKPGSSSPTLSVSFGSGLAAASTSSSMPYGTPYTVSGCGYNAANGGVTVVVHSPEAIAFAGQVPNANGCISLTNFSTQGPGHYQLDAWQHIGHRDVDVASTSFDLS
jgi:hypothetical protein